MIDSFCPSPKSKQTSAHLSQLTRYNGRTKEEITQLSARRDLMDIAARLPFAFLLIAALFLTGCGGSSNNSPTPTPVVNVADVHGSWKASAANPNGTTGSAIEMNLSQSGAKVSANDSDPVHPNVVLLFEDTTTGDVSLNSPCGDRIGHTSFSGTLDSSGKLTFTLTEDADVFTGTAQLNSTNDKLDGTYQSTASSACQDSGEIHAVRASSLTRTVTLMNATCVTNWLTGDCSFTDVAIPSVQMTENSNYTLTVVASGTLSDGTVMSGTLNGYVAGDVAYASGSVNNQPVEYYAWDNGSCSTDGGTTSFKCTGVFDTNLNLVGMLIPTDKVPTSAHRAVQTRGR